MNISVTLFAFMAELNVLFAKEAIAKIHLLKLAGGNFFSDFFKRYISLTKKENHIVSITESK